MKYIQGENRKQYCIQSAQNNQFNRVQNFAKILNGEGKFKFFDN
jgi:hypothetical protein